MKFKKKKVVNYRGSKTHGCGSMKKRRGAGSRGGRGNSGSGKRGDANKQTFQKAGVIPGKHGFKSKRVNKIKAINVSDVQKFSAAWLTEGKVSKKADAIVVELANVGFNKLLGSGNVTEKLLITVDSASPKAVEKVQKAGGKVNLPSTATEAAPEPSKE